MPRLLLVDNYDSFTYNLVQYLGDLGADIEVVRNDRIDVAGIAAKKPDGLVISPGPGNPDEAGVSLAAIAALGPTMPILGVCLGHQAIGQAFGGRVVRADTIMHGKTSPMAHDGTGLFAGLPDPMIATRYHSLVVSRDGLPDTLRVTSWTADGTIMGLAHRTLPIHGVQFHPESILTEGGHALLKNFLDLLPCLSRT